ncbi:hypothetical protein EDB87DRAFT_19072 [Lactarius vividus]|nr:hypothetical protein EDB87DRAFT_19072 [Lactarius vividus]
MLKTAFESAFSSFAANVATPKQRPLTGELGTTNGQSLFASAEKSSTSPHKNPTFSFGSGSGRPSLFGSGGPSSFGSGNAATPPLFGSGSAATPSFFGSGSATTPSLFGSGSAATPSKQGSGSAATPSTPLSAENVVSPGAETPIKMATAPKVNPADSKAPSK